MKHGNDHDSRLMKEADSHPKQRKWNKVMIRRLGQDYGMLMYPDRPQDAKKKGIDGICEKERPHPDINAQGYTARFPKRIFFGYTADIYAPDGRQIVVDTKVRKGFKREFPDPMNEGLTIELRLGIIGKDTLSLRRLSEIMIESEEDVEEAVKMIAGAGEKVDPERLKRMMRHLPELNLLDSSGSCRIVSSDATLYCRLCSSLGKAAERGIPIESSFPSIIKLLADCDDEVRLNATFPLIMAVTYGQDITIAVPALQAAMHDRYRNVRENAEIALALIDLMAGRIRI